MKVNTIMQITEALKQRKTAAELTFKQIKETTPTAVLSEKCIEDMKNDCTRRIAKINDAIEDWNRTEFSPISPCFSFLGSPEPQAEAKEENRCKCEEESGAE